MDINSLAHTKWNCKVSHCICTKIQKKNYIWKAEKRYSKYTQHALQKKGSKDYRGRDVSRPCTYAGGNSPKYQHIKFHGIFEGKKHPDDI